ncbi:hypothetical protein [Oscillatoria salina]
MKIITQIANQDQENQNRVKNLIFVEKEATATWRQGQKLVTLYQ